MGPFAICFARCKSCKKVSFKKDMMQDKRQWIMQDKQDISLKKLGEKSLKTCGSRIWIKFCIPNLRNFELKTEKSLKIVKLLAKHKCCVLAIFLGYARCLKITEKVLFNIASEASLNFE